MNTTGNFSLPAIEDFVNPRNILSLDSSALPILKIETNGQEIVDDPKIQATLQIISNDQGNFNYVNDTNYTYSGYIGIEIRGSSSQSFPKKSYGLETWDATGDDIDASLLGMPKESDWVLNAHYTDKTLFRNNLSYELFNQMGHYAPRTQLVEVILNGEYRGVYSFMEKIKRNKNRVNIPKMSEDANSGSALTGGYIFKIDRANGSGGDGWQSKFEIPARPGEYTTFLYEYPKDDKITTPQKIYLQSFVDSFEQAMYSDQFTDPVNGWRKYADELSMIDFMLVQEMSKNVDAYRLSTFLYKTADNEDNKIHFGPVWDFDIAWFNADYCEAFKPEGWAYNNNYICWDGRSPFWWEKVMTDPLFLQNLKCRWESLRQTILSTTNIGSIINSYVDKMAGAEDRNFEKWPILGVYVWPNPQPIPDTYEGEINKLRYWINVRFAWMDNIIQTISPDVHINIESTYNADEDQYHFTHGDALGGSFSWDFGDGTNSTEANPAHHYENPGDYVVTVNYNNGFGCDQSATYILKVSGLSNHDLNQSNLILYPNPTGDFFYLNTEFITGISKLKITTTGGTQVYSTTIGKGKHEKIDVRNLPGGIYLITLLSENHISQGKLVKL
ncbi:MAG: CotH kinase family protein [Saprospiraceae bacterium]|nr:CotH kinase family protein [Saprospiraceae bacterium]